MKRLLPFLLVAAIGGAVAVLIPAVVAPQAFLGSVFRDLVARPSVWAFQGLFVVGFVLALVGKLEWSDLPLVAVSMVALFPVKAGVELAAGSTEITWPREFYLYAAWLIPSIGGLAMGQAVRAARKRAEARENEPRKGTRRQAKKRGKR